MNITLRRYSYVADGIFGRFYDDANNILCSTLEHAFVQPGGNYLPIIPPGAYTCQRRLSPKFGYDVFEVLDVPGHDYVEIHIGDWNKDSDGCILLGSSSDGSRIYESAKAFKAFMDLQSGVNEFSLVVS